MASQQSNASAKKIANYTQSISSGVTNLLSELGRVNAAPPFDPGPIETQLQTLITLVQGMDTRLAALEQGLQRLESGNVPGLMEIAPAAIAEVPGLNFMPKLTADEYNARARRHNKTLKRGNDALMPLRTASNQLAVGFPSTLGHLMSLDHEVRTQLQKVFNLTAEFGSLWTFIGANIELNSMLTRGLYCTPELLAELRMDKRANRERDIAAAGPVTASTKKAAAAHNRVARAQNAITKQSLKPMHDDRNIPVHGSPKTLFGLANPYRQWDVLYLLEEYGQSVEEKTGCLARLVKFFGADVKELLGEDIAEGDGRYGSYWYM